MITKIETVETLDTMGEATQEDLNRWVDFFREALAEEYPGAEISVKAGRQEKLVVETSGDFIPADCEDDVREFRNRCWDKWI